MPIESDQRQRLAAVMEDRRLELRLTWQQVAERGDISLRALSSARAGSGDIRPLTRRGIDKGLQWVEGRGVDAILAGHDPQPAIPEPTLPVAANTARALGIDPDDPNDRWTRPIRDLVEGARRIHGDSPSGPQVFHGRPDSGTEAGVWDNPALSEKSKILAIAILRAMAVRDSAGSQNHGRSGRAGLALVVASGRP